MERQIVAGHYGRVSTEEQVEGYSLDAQRRAFQTLVAERGWVAYREYLDEGKSAHHDDISKRPGFRQAIDDALAGKYDVLVVHKLDRFSRSLLGFAQIMERLSTNGAGIISVTQQLDTSTSTGRLSNKAAREWSSMRPACWSMRPISANASWMRAD